MERALFLDRGGAIHQDAGSIFCKEQVQFVDGVFSLCQTAKRLGYRIVVISYELGLAQGLYNEADYRAVMRWIREEFRREGAVFDGIYRCPSGARPIRPVVLDAPRPVINPGAGMLRRAAKDLHLSLSESLLVGSRSIDVAAANAGGLNHAFLLRGSDELTCGGANTAVDSLGEVEAWLVAHGKGANLPPASQSLAAA